MKILLAALLSVALIQVHDGSTPANLNNSVTKTPIRQTVRTAANETQPVQQEQPAPQPPKVTEPEPVVQQASQPSPSASGSCAAEIAKYNWSHNVALAVARAESGLNPLAVNNNPSTGDYSVGCFQVNIYGRNAYTRPSEWQLKNPSTNVAWAYKIYASNGHSFIGQWGVCRYKVSCY